MNRNQSVPDHILDDLFHGCAFAAYVRLAAATGQQPDLEATRQLAYRLYEESLRERTAPAVRSQD
jgi:hypothetical protein